MEILNFEPYTFTFKNRENKRYIFDVIRKKDVMLTPEEWVRQHCIHFLLKEKQYPIGLINVEKIYVCADVLNATISLCTNPMVKSIF